MQNTFMAYNSDTYSLRINYFFRGETGLALNYTLLDTHAENRSIGVWLVPPNTFQTKEA